MATTKTTKVEELDSKKLLDIFMDSLYETYPKDQLTPCLMLSKTKHGRYIVKVQRYIDKENSLNVLTVSSIISMDDAIIIAIKTWREMLDKPKESAVQILLNLEILK